MIPGLTVMKQTVVMAAINATPHRGGWHKNYRMVLWHKKWRFGKCVQWFTTTACTLYLSELWSLGVLSCSRFGKVIYIFPSVNCFLKMLLAIDEQKVERRIASNLQEEWNIIQKIAATSLGRWRELSLKNCDKLSLSANHRSKICVDQNNRHHKNVQKFH